MSHTLTSNPYGLDSFAQGWDGFWKRLVTPESVEVWDRYFGQLDRHKPFEWQYVGLWDMGRRIRWIQFHCPTFEARERSGRVVEGATHLMSPELQRLEFEALRRHIEKTKPRP